MTATVSVVDLGMGNVGSVANMVRKAGGSAVVVSDADDLGAADRIVLPGVGAFDTAMSRLVERGFVEQLQKAVDVGTPVLGICLGMQLLADRSEEGNLAGLGWIPGSVERLPVSGPNGPIRVPHMGWSSLVGPIDGPSVRPIGHPVLADAAEGSRFYFVHSYAFRPTDPTSVVARADHGGIPFVAAVARANVLGVQFHPEKSHRHGMALVRSFLAWSP